MRVLVLASLLAALPAAAAPPQEPPLGRWTTIDDASGKPSPSATTMASIEPS